MSYIYFIRNIITEDIYIGSTNNYTIRFNEHRRQLRKNTHHSAILQNSYNKHGLDNFEFTIVDSCDLVDKLLSDNYVYVRVNNGYLCYEVVHKEGWHYNIFVFDDSNNVNFNQDIHGFRTQSSEQILKYKKQYSRPKDLEDLKDIPF